ncbi:MAG TPA: hypothetical protein VKB14_08780 [Actinomycetales bacterium]|nr:hypothetical protein [Actinomycetales bacterium]
MMPLLLELDDDTWSSQVDRVERWLATSRMLQAAYARVLESTLNGVAEPHIRSYLDELLEVAREHENRVDDLYRAFGREPAAVGTVRSTASALLAMTREAVGHAEGTAGGAASGPWRGLREVLLSNVDAIAGFAVTEQLGLALGVPAVVDVTMPVVRRKTQDQLLLQEYLLEMASNAVLRGRDF